jgi:DNA (cytosine-5)-methyltransferase 1
MLKFGSVCSGIEAASVAWEPLGWRAAWLSEIEPFPSAVLKHHYPDVPNLGDMTTLPERILSGEVEAPDLFCGGTPCQAFSVAGLRKSLGDARGNLSLTFCEIANAIDDTRLVRGLPASIVFWENVPGVLSTTDNAFGCFLAALVGGDEPLNAPDGWPNAGCVDGPQRSAAWRVLDAQYFGVAQRRRRVFVVASARADFDPAKVLFEWGGVRRDTAPSRETGKAVAPTTGESAAISEYDVAGTLDKGVPGRGIGHNGNYDSQVVPIINAAISSGHGYWLDAGDKAATLRAQDSITKADTLLAQPYPVANCLTARMHKGINSTVDEGQTPVIAHSLTASRSSTQCPTEDTTLVPIALQDVTPREKAQNGRGWNDDGTAYTVDTHATQGVAQAIPIDTMNMTPGHSSGGLGFGQPGDPSFTLTKGHSHAVAQPIAFHPTQDPINSEDGSTHAMGTGSAGGCATVMVAHVVGALACNTGPNGHDAGNFACNQAVDAGHVLPVAQPLNIYGGNKRQDRPEGGFYVRMGEDTSKTLDAATGLNPTCAQGGTAVMQAMAYNIAPGKGKLKDDIHVTDANISKTIDASGSNPSMHQGGTAVMQPIAFQQTADCLTAAYGTKWNGNASATNGSLFAAQPIGWSEELTASIDLAGTLQRGGAGGRHDGVMQPNMAVRRLTPVECERLQGFPDGYTDIKLKGKATPDGPRYKALGNSWAVPVVAWIGRRIQENIRVST